MDRNIIAVMLCVVCIVALYFVQDRRTRMAFGVGAVVAALFARWMPKRKPVRGRKPDTKDKARDAVDVEINEVWDAVDAASVSPPGPNRESVERLRARLRRRRERLHNTGRDRADD